MRRAESEARESEQRFRILVEHAPEAILVYDLDLDRFVDANSSAQRMLGLSREQLLAKGPFDLYSAEQPDALPLGLMVEEHLRRAMLGEPVLVERNVRRADGSVFPCEVRLVRLPMAYLLGHIIWQTSTGVFLSMLVGQMVQSSLLLYIFERKDWPRFSMIKRRVKE